MRAFLFTLLAAGTALGAEPATDLLHWMDAIAQAQLDRRAAAIARIRTPEQARTRQAFVRRKVLELIGGLPDYDGALNARTTGQIVQPGFVIEKILWQSLPGLYVSANLYRPRKAGRFPAILLPLGHWEYGKPAVQRIAANLALKGFVVLTYDPIGQGERLQAYDQRIGASLIGGATGQHLMDGAKEILMGRSFARDRIFDAKRALDYLETRPDVDKERIGVTGCSGGGTVTTYIAALDERIKAAAPACYITSFRELFRGSVGDSEQSIAGFLASGLDLADYVESFAPKPWLIGATEDDFFPIAGTKEAFEEATRWYRIFGAGDRVKLVIGPGGHGTPLVVREAIYEWMIRWLENGEGSAKEQDVPLLPEFELRATESGQVAGLPSSRDLSEVLREGFEKQKTHGSDEELRKTLLEWMAEPDGAPPYAAAVPDIEVPPDAGSKRAAVLLVGTHRSAALAARARELAASGEIAGILVPRGLPAPADPGHPFAGDWLTSTRASLIGANLAGMRAHDIINGVSVLARREDIDLNNITAEAEGVAGIWLLMAAAIDPRIKSITLHSTPYSLRAALEEPIARDLDDAALPGFAMKWDLDDLVKLMHPRTVIWIDPMDWLRHVKQLPGDYRYTPAEQ